MIRKFCLYVVVVVVCSYIIADEEDHAVISHLFSGFRVSLFDPRNVRSGLGNHSWQSISGVLLFVIVLSHWVYIHSL